MTENDTGNVAAMRSALEKIKKLNRYDLGCIRSRKRREEFDAKILEIENVIRAALAEPARNCDVGTAKEQAERFKAFCLPRVIRCSENSRCPAKHPCNEIGIQYCQLKWAQLPYEAEGKEESNGSK